MVRNRRPAWRVTLTEIASLIETLPRPEAQNGVLPDSRYQALRERAKRSGLGVLADTPHLSGRTLFVRIGEKPRICSFDGGDCATRPNFMQVAAAMILSLPNARLRV